MQITIMEVLEEGKNDNKIVTLTEEELIKILKG